MRRYTLFLFCLLLPFCAHAQSFTGLIKPLDCTDYTGTVSDYSKSYMTLFRDTENGVFSTYYEGIGSHPGVDIARLSSGLSSNGAGIKAVYDGTIARIYYNTNDWGFCLVLQHDNIPGTGTVYSCYGHMTAILGGFSVGSFINKGQIIGYVGNTGHSTGPHLHFQIDKVYTDYGGIHPYFPPNVNVPDTNGIVLNHSYNPMYFIRDHSTPVNATDIYVDAGYNGSNGTSDGSSGRPYTNMTTAVNAASPTQAVVMHVRGGTYHVSNLVIHKNIKIVNNGGGVVNIGK